MARSRGATLASRVRKKVWFWLGKEMENRSLPATDRIALNDFNRNVLKLSGSIGAARQTLREISTQMKHINNALMRAEVPHDDELITMARNLEKKAAGIKVRPRAVSVLTICRRYEFKCGRNKTVVSI